MIKEWLIKHILKNNIFFIKNNENKEYFLIKDIVFDESDLGIVIYETQTDKKLTDMMADSS